MTFSAYLEGDALVLRFAEPLREGGATIDEHRLALDQAYQLER